jgi:hypothetical protein
VETVQEASWYFFAPLVAAYGAAIGGWMLITRLWPRTWPEPIPAKTDRKWLDFALVFAGAAGIAAISLMHGKKLLLPQTSGWGGILAWNLNVLLIYSPVFVIPLLRRQRFETIYLSSRRLGTKVLMGVALGLLAVLVFHVARGQVGQLPGWAAQVIDVRLFAKYFAAVFLEGVALAFVLVRVKWALRLWPAVLIPSILFALGHVPRSMEAGESGATIITFLIINTALVTFILYVVQKSRDVIWLGIPHYMMDVAIRAFGT